MIKPFEYNSSSVAPTVPSTAPALPTQGFVKDFVGGPDYTPGAVVRNTIIGLPGAAVDVAKSIGGGIKDMFTNPSPEQKHIEQLLGPPKNPLEKYVLMPTYKTITRFLSPIFQPFADDVAEIHEVSRKGGIADQIAAGRIPPAVLDQFAVLQKTAPQIVGDVAQAVLATGVSGLAAEEAVVPKGMSILKYGIGEGLKVGTAFGGAQAASSGSKDPAEIAAIIGLNSAIGGLFGGTVSGIASALSRVKVGKTAPPTVAPKVGATADPSQTVAGHFKYAKAVYSDPDFKGNIGDFMKAKQVDIVDGLKAEGHPNEAAAIQKLDTSQFKNFDDFERAAQESINPNVKMAGQLRTNELLQNGQKEIPQPGSSESLIESSGGWQEGMKGIFDTALKHNDKGTIYQMIKEGSVPQEYQSRFSNEIKGVLGGASAAASLGIAPASLAAAPFFDFFKPKVPEPKLPEPKLPVPKVPVPEVPGVVGLPSVNLSTGATGSSVQQLQNYLVSKGYMTEAEKNTGYGTYGPKTKAAVAKLQRDLGVDVGNDAGTYGPKTRDAIAKGIPKTPVPTGKIKPFDYVNGAPKEEVKAPRVIDAGVDTAPVQKASAKIDLLSKQVRQLQEQGLPATDQVGEISRLAELHKLPDPFKSEPTTGNLTPSEFPEKTPPLAREEITQQGPISPELEALMTEAKKFGSSEDFVKAVDTAVKKAGSGKTPKQKLTLSPQEKSLFEVYQKSGSSPERLPSVYREAISTPSTIEPTAPPVIDFKVEKIDGQKVFAYGQGDQRIVVKPHSVGYNERNLKVGETVLIHRNELHPKSTSKGKSVTLNSGINPHFDVFLQEDLKPAFKTGTGGVTKTWDFVKKIFDPKSRSGEARQTAAILREGLAKMARRKEIVYRALEKSKKVFDGFTKEQSLEFIDNLETGKSNPGAEGFTKTMREALDERWRRIQEIKGTDAYIENYFPHIWKDPTRATEVLAGYGRRPLEGTKGYLKERSIPTIKEGIERGLEPESYNPVELVMARISDMDRFLMANDVWGQFKDFGLRKFIRMGDDVPNGWIKVDDKISQVFQFSEAEKGMILRGHWYMPEPAATILNHYLSPGLVHNPIYDGLRMIGNTLNQVQLGVSAYHAFFTSSDAVISKAALEIQKMFSKTATPAERFVSAGKALALPVTAPYFLWKNITRGNKLLNDYFEKYPQVPALVDALERSGGRVKMDSFYYNDAVSGFLKAIRSENLVGAVLRTPGAAVEALAKPIMQYLVPRQKLGVFADGAKFILEQAQKEGWSEYKTTLRLQEMWDSVDNRMGQLVYDNLFWHRVVKDLGMVSTRSLGWNLGTVRELGGGAVEYAKTIPKLATEAGRDEIRMTPKMAYVLALPYVAGVWGAMIYYLYNGKAPETLLDYFYPKTGKKKPDGTAERISIPTYMKDVFAWKTEGFQTAINKLHPEISAIIQMLQNKDYFGTEIRNPNDSWVEQIKDLGAYQVKQYVPFTITNLMQRQKTGGSWFEYLQSFGGVTPAPAYITRSPLQAEIYETYDQRFGGGVRSQEQTEIAQQKADVRTLYLQGKTAEANKALDALVAIGIVKDKAQFIQEADIPNDVKLFTQLPIDDQRTLIKKMDLYELERYAWYVKKDLKEGFSQLSDNTKIFVQLVQSGDTKKPVWEKNVDINLEIP